MEKINFKSIAEKLGKFFSSLGKVAIIVTAMASGYAASEIYHRYESGIKTNKMQDVRTGEKTSVAINERGELMVINRSSGSYQIYGKDVMDMIFSLRAQQIYQDQKTK
jgi:hypothetical protein